MQRQHATANRRSLRLLASPYWECPVERTIYLEKCLTD